MRNAWRGIVCHCLADPGERDTPGHTELLEDGLLVIEDGRVAALGHARDLLPDIGDVAVEDHSGRFILPGFIDCHVHYPQLDIVASYGEQLLDWLNHYAYPAESRFADPDYAADVANRFLDAMLANGTTTALVFGTVHAHSADALFEAAAARNLRLVAGKVLMDRNCPAALCESTEAGTLETRHLIEKWHGRGRLGYAITPRFALTSSEEQLRGAGRLAVDYPDVWVHTHLAENKAEVDAVARMYPDSNSYLDVYDQAGLVRERSVFAHCLHLGDNDVACMASRHAAAAFCPTSNLFLGSGLFDLRRLRGAGVRCGLATDVGGGTSLSMPQTINEAYKVLQLQQQSLPATRALWLATLGAAEALCLDDKIGNFATGKEADFVVVDPAASPQLRERCRTATDVKERLFATLMLADERHIARTCIAGRPYLTGSR